MPPILRNGSFLFVLQSQPFYQAQLVPVTTISILRCSLSQLARLVPMTIISILGSLAMFVSRCSSEKSEMGLVHEEWMGKDG